MTKRAKEILKMINNAVFPSKEDDGVEHIDMSYKEFMALIKELASLSASDSITLNGGQLHY